MLKNCVTQKGIYSTLLYKGIFTKVSMEKNFPMPYKYNSCIEDMLKNLTLAYKPHLNYVLNGGINSALAYKGKKLRV